MNSTDSVVLLITADAHCVDVVRAALAREHQAAIVLAHSERIEDGVERVREGSIAAILLDPDLPGSQGLEAFDRLVAAAPGIPVLLLCAAHDEARGRQAVSRGAQDYLLKEHLEDHWLAPLIQSLIGRKETNDALFLEKQLAYVTLNAIGDAVLCADADGRVTYLNLVAEKMTGWSLAEALAKPISDVFRVVRGDTRESAQDPVELAVAKDRIVELGGNRILVRRDGSESAIEDSAAPIHNRAGEVTGAVVICRDVSETRAMALKMSHSAQHDFLTGLPNRMLLNDRLHQEMASARRHGDQRAVLFLDLDRFKHINDSLGHPIGDKLLQAVAQRLVTCVRDADTVSRPGGDEFVLVLTEVEEEHSVELAAEKILSALSLPYTIDDHDLHVTASIGISIFPDHGQDAESLIKCADTAMYHAKDHGRNNYQFFAQDMNVRAVERQSLEGALRRALQRHELILHYQPQMNLASGAISGAEALIRWTHPVRGTIYPTQFVPIAEDCGLIMPLGQWVLREACRQAQAWLARGLPIQQMAVNISAVEVRHKGFVNRVRSVLEETGLAPHHLELELTETVLMEEAHATDSVLWELKDMGVQLAVDDFGTGYSSLSYLRRFPIDTLKIDQSFVQDIGNSDETPIVGAVIKLAKSLDKLVVAEGVETATQLAYLREQSCDEGQGYYFSRPIVAAGLAALLGA